ncbi:MAG: FG-GAP repeat protein [Chitinophagaceae bacterium]|nr:FG-GAP repeat protein [Chitinophagaceae bacterium]
MAVDNLYGNYIAVGAPGRKVGNNSAQGKAYLYNANFSSLGFAAEVTASNGAANDFFGCSVSISGSYAVIGAYGKDVGGNVDQGCAYIFQKETGSSNWNQVAILTASDGAGGDWFGYSLSISGNYIIVGAYNKNVGGNNYQGKAYIFYRTGSAWSQQAILTAADLASGNNFGYSVSISGDYAVVGTPGKMIEGKQFVGKAYVYNRTGSTWSLQAEIIASERDRFDDFGSSVSISEDNIVIGAPQWLIATESKGKAYVFKRSGTNWYQQARLVASDGHYGDDFGTSVAINGQYIAVGAPGFDYTNSSGQTYSNTGKIYFFNTQ